MTRRYPAYKDSGVEWLGEVPEGWAVSSIKRVASIKYGIGEPPRYRDEGVPLIRATNVDAGRICTDGLVLIDPADIPANRITWLSPGDIIVVRSGAYTGDSAIIEPAHCPAIAGFDMVLKPFGIYPPFLAFLLLSSEVKQSQIDLEKMRAAQPHLNAEEIGSCIIPLPPLPEQTAIAAFLDRETAKIDALVAEQRRLIDLLREKRQAVISHAVTKGLNPGAPLKPSGIDWLGDVPEGWEVKRLSLVCGFEQGKAHEPYFDDDGDFICVTARFVSTGGEKFKRCSANLTPAAVGDILMVMSDLPNGRALARAFLVDRPEVYAVNQRVCRITVKPVGDARYFAYQLNRHTTLLSEDDGFNQTHLSNASFTKLQLVVPPEDEQKRIADYLDARAGAFDTLTTTAETAITLLQERRAALISAAVTGKIDVRPLSPAATEAA